MNYKRLQKLEETLGQLQNCVCSKSRYLNRVCGFIFIICTLTLRGAHFVHPFVFSIMFSHGSRESRIPQKVS